MVGRDIGDTFANLRRNKKIGDVILEVKGLTTDLLRDVSFSAHAGEILGFAGLVGAGRTETMRAIFGADPIKSGEITLKGKPTKFTSPKDAIDSGIALCPEDRKEQGLVLLRSIRDNISMPVLRRIKNGIVISYSKESVLADEAVSRYDIRTPSIEKIAMELSGGNQQKVILGRWTSNLLNTDVLILDEPTKGIDVSTKAEIYQIICDLASAGKTVLFISSELTEVLNISDRIIVMHEGKVTGEIARSDATEESVMALAMEE
jgi:ABC-type sugar transport system ATPase subunit